MKERERIYERDKRGREEGGGRARSNMCNDAKKKNIKYKKHGN